MWYCCLTAFLHRSPLFFFFFLMSILILFFHISTQPAAWQTIGSDAYAVVFDGGRPGHSIIRNGKFETHSVQITFLWYRDYGGQPSNCFEIEKNQSVLGPFLNVPMFWLRWWIHGTRQEHSVSINLSDFVALWFDFFYDKICQTDLRFSRVHQDMGKRSYGNSSAMQSRGSDWFAMSRSKQQAADRNNPSRTHMNGMQGQLTYFAAAARIGWNKIE